MDETPGTTVTIPPSVPHAVVSVSGARLITVFSPGGFDRYLEELAAMPAAQFNDSVIERRLAERYDTWTI
jgi:hypothetical protein